MKKPVVPIFLIGIAMMAASCQSMNVADRLSSLSALAGSNLGASIGRKAGNAAIGETIGKFYGTGTGLFINNTLTKSSKTLYIIDGEPYKVREARNKLQNIDPGTIASVKVLDNEQAISLYGEKGQYGAILIDLKKI
ncbi:TonB-dependent receptor plug domain-containing protein [Pedobacter sp. BS3]|uniref:TonB-dependent receptor plug domain-containing protein n=1 Tax=Pedobacter sp. BS3 TaxID=2567937 RepID=UPI0011EF3BDF|nr:TonB-dependent receptor plug domain-containing protein [Pedobacter sp. BS3]TZF83259.1 TonB-dependent receptor plug domain-containing protein [Pedobacter sp. BS3]